MLDIFVLFGLEWLSDKVEDRYGRRAAWIFALMATLAVVGVLVWILIMVLRR
jgi:Na+/melibiose symporter-like transporter